MSSFLSMLRAHPYIRLVLLLLSAVTVSSCSSMADDVFALDRVSKASQARYGNQVVPVIQNWATALNRIQPSREERKLQQVNDYLNMSLSFQLDQSTWGVRDYWATPVEALWRGRADCEDYAIAKYFSLKFLGVDPKKLRITYVRARTGVGQTGLQAHMVLAYYATPDADPLVLDNLMSEVRPASRRADLTPVFSFNADGVWRVTAGEPQQEQNDLSQWQGVLNKMKLEGFE